MSYKEIVSPSPFQPGILQIRIVENDDVVIHCQNLSVESRCHADPNISLLDDVWIVEKVVVAHEFNHLMSMDV